MQSDGHTLKIGKSPLVAGVLAASPRKFPPPGPAPACDLVEVRLDLTRRPADWLDRCRAIQAAGWPVLLTIRLAAEGGRWRRSDEDRLPLFEQALSALAAVDVEWRSPLAPIVAARAKKLRKTCVISFHDFDKTPSAGELESVISQAQKIASVVKIATRLHSLADQGILESLLAKKWKKPLCVIGMGPAFARTRVRFPKLGSCLAYGYLEEPTAPGQFSAAQLSKLLRQPA